MEKDDLTESMLRRLYWDEGKSLTEISEETGVFSFHVWRKMKTFGIERRSPLEGQLLKRERERAEEEEQEEEAEADRPDKEEERERVSDRIYFSPLHYYVEEVMDGEPEPTEIPGVRVYET